MTAHIHSFPADPTIFSRLTERQRQANIAEERAEAITCCKRIIDNPRGYTNAQLREVCGFYMTYGDGGVHYLRADEHIAAINKREFIARNCPRQETSRDVLVSMRGRLPEALFCAAGLAVVLLAGTGWLS